MRTRLILPAAAALLCLHLAASKGNPVGLIEDDSVQVLLARSLRHGGFALPDAQGVPVSDPLPGYAALLLGPVWLAEPRWGLLRGVPLAAMVLAVFFTWRLGWRLLPAPWPLAAAGLTALSPVFVRHSGLVLPDIPYLALTLMALDLGTRSGSWALTGCAWAAAAWAGLIRPHGGLLCLALAAGALATPGRRRQGAFLLSSLAPLGLWLLRNKLAAGVSTGYAVNWRSQVALLGEPGAQGSHALAVIASFFGDGLAGAQAPGWLVLAAGLALASCAAWGAGRLMTSSREETPLVFAMAAYTVLVLVLHLTWSPEDSRYVIPLAPLVWLFAASAIGSLSPSDRPAQAWLGRAALALLALAALRQDARLVSASLTRPASYQARTMEWVRLNSPPDAVVESLKFNTVMLLTGRQCLPPPLGSSGPREWVETSRQAGVTHIHVEHSFLPGGFVPAGARDMGALIGAWAESSLGAPVFRDDAEGASVFAIPSAGAPRTR
ncbi:MAG: hypothetical protein HY924_09010 [Elusimicrobia bacterium]|nr:hypothetical protein [Elusimicrobiota bacterium]